MPGPDPVAAALAVAAHDPQGAIGQLAALVAAQAHLHPAWRQLGDALHAAGKGAMAVRCYEASLSSSPADADAWYGLGRAHAAAGDHAAAAHALQRSVQLEPHHAAALHELGRAWFELGCVEHAMGCLRQALALGNDAVRRQALTNLAVLVPGSPVDDARSIRSTRQAFARLLPSAPRRAPRSTRAGPLRVGYVSAFFHQAHWMKPVWALLRHHDRTAVEVHLFVEGGGVDATGYAAHANDRIHDLSGLGNTQVAACIAQAELDVLVDLNGFSAPERLPVFALRPAPVQVAWFNQYATTGMDCFDALIGDGHVVRPEEEVDYDERILRVPHSYLAFQVEHATPPVAPAPRHATGQFTFGALASLYKLNDATLRCWAAILAQCPDARLLLRNSGLGPANHRAHLTARLAACGVPAQRVLLLGPAPHLEFLATYDQVDLALDPFPYSGGTTTMEALWQGVPVVTLEGDRWAARTSVSLLRAAGLDAFVARDARDYVARCVALAHAPAALDALRAGLRPQLARAPVCDAASLARAMERIYRTLV